MNPEYWISTLGRYVVDQKRLSYAFGFVAIINACAMRHGFDIISMESKKEQSSAFPLEPYHRKGRTFKYFKKVLDDRQAGNYFGSVENWSLHGKDIDTTCDKSNISMEMRNSARISFHVGYAIAQVPGSLLAERYGGRCILAISLALTAFLSFLTPCVVASHNTLGVIVLRILMGFSEGPIFPALTIMMVQWIPQNERGTLISLLLSAGDLGILIYNLLSAFLFSHCEWPIIFYFFGACSFLWLVCFIIFCCNNPEANPYNKEIGLKENVQMRGIQSSTSAGTLSNLFVNIDQPINIEKYKNTPWKDIFTNGSVWALILANVQHDWSQSLLNSEIYDKIGKWKNIKLRGSLNLWLKATIPFALNWLVSVLAGTLSDVLVNKHILNTTEVRRIMTLIGAFGPKICSHFISCLLRTECNDFLTLFNCALSTTGAYYAGSKLTAFDLSPNYAEILMALSNTFASVANIVAPLLENVANESGQTQNLRSILWLLCTIFTSGDVQSFNAPVVKHLNV